MVEAAEGVESPGIGRQRVLLVDDEVANLEVLASALEGSYQLSFANSAADAMRLAELDGGPDMLLLDVVLGNSDGFELCLQLKANPATAHIPVIFVSALCDPANEQHGLAVGAIDYINKPIVPEVVRARVAVHMEVRRHRAFFESVLERRTQDLRSAEEEVRELVQAVRTSEARFRAYAEASSDWFWEADEVGRVTYVSDPDALPLMLAGSHLLVLSRDAGDLEDARRYPSKWDGLWRALEAREPVRNFEYPVVSESGDTRYVQVSATPNFAADGRFLGYRGVGSDVSAAVESAKQAATLRDAINAAKEVVILYDAQQRVLFTNDEYHRCFPSALPKDEIVGATVHELLCRATSKGIYQNAEAREDPEGYVEAAMEHFELEAPPVREMKLDSGRTYLRRQRRGVEGETLVLWTDITELKDREQRLHEQRGILSRMASELSLAEERERRRISAELHDGPVQTLGLASIKLSALCSRVEGTPYAVAADAIRGPLDEAIASVRHLMGEVSPPVLYELGLAAALEWLTNRYRGTAKLDIDFEARGAATPVSVDTRVLLFQATRELLASAVEQARATRVCVCLCWSESQVMIDVSDNGPGADANAEAANARHAGGDDGLFSLRERLRLLAGDLQLKRGAAGTSVRLCLPIDARDQA